MSTSTTPCAGDSARKQRFLLPTILIVKEDDDVHREAIDIGCAAGYSGVLPDGAVFLAKPFNAKRLAAILAEAA
jgi:hypothetical protein